MSRRAQNNKRVQVTNDFDDGICFDHEENTVENTNVFRYLSCPCCQNKRLQDVVTAGSRLKQCPHCQGIWFNLNELERVLGDGLKLTWRKDNKASTTGTNHKPLCPICQTRLVRTKSLEISDLIVWACQVCQGRWVDGDEITKLQKRGLLSSIKEFVMRLF
ncbi:zf-TFIIB domain-containing protein [Planctomycetota bacterium]